jgi:dolichyl-phosphate beta-glucosyltransferase
MRGEYVFEKHTEESPMHEEVRKISLKESKDNKQHIGISNENERIVKTKTIPQLLSVVIPAYNEEKRIGRTIRKILAYLKRRKIRHEIIVVDDGSTDETLRVLKGCDVKIIIIGNEENRGKGHSVKMGALACKGDYMLFTDADLSTPIEELDRLLAFLPGYDILIASRKEPGSKIIEKQPYIRRLAGNLFPIIVRLMTGTRIKDTQCGFKLFDMKRCRVLFQKQSIEGFSFDVELLYQAERRGLKIKEIPVFWCNDSKTKVKLIKDSAAMFAGILKIRKNDMMGHYD